MLKFCIWNQGARRFYKGMIAAVISEDTFDVAYSDGDHEFNVPRENIQIDSHYLQHLLSKQRDPIDRIADQSCLAPVKPRTGKWTDLEHDTFVKGICGVNGYNFAALAAFVGSRDVYQTRNHTKSYFNRLTSILTTFCMLPDPDCFNPDSVRTELSTYEKRVLALFHEITSIPGLGIWQQKTHFRTQLVPLLKELGLPDIPAQHLG